MRRAIGIILVSLVALCFNTALLLGAGSTAGFEGEYRNVKAASTTNATATTFCKLNATTNNSGGSVTVFYTVTASDASSNNDTKTIEAVVDWGNKAGTVTATALTKSTSTGNNAGATGSITAPFSVSVSGTAISLTTTPAFATIVPTAVEVYYYLVPFGPCTISPQ